MAIYGEIGHENGICLTKGALGPVLLALGDNGGSVHISRQAVNICSRFGDRSKAAIALLSLGRALRLQGNVNDAIAAAVATTIALASAWVCACVAFGPRGLTPDGID